MNVWPMLAIIWGAALLMCMLSAMRPAFPHDAEGWIADSKLRDPLSGAWCCGPSDCRAEKPDAIQVTAGGYYIVESHETVPYSRAIPLSPDGLYHRCVIHHWSNLGYSSETRCLITPPMGE